VSEQVHSTMTGFMRQMPDGSIIAEICDCWGFVQHLTGTPVAGGGWTLAVRVVVPEPYRLPLLDEPGTGR
jgi:hypothetical protein